MIGVITKVVGDRGFGFIRRTDGEADVFFHHRSLDRTLIFSSALVGESVQFDVQQNEKGPRAVNVRAI
jgi:CspA family cold shock protein